MVGPSVYRRMHPYSHPLHTLLSLPLTPPGWWPSTCSWSMSSRPPPWAKASARECFLFPPPPSANTHTCPPPPPPAHTPCTRMGLHVAAQLALVAPAVVGWPGPVIKHPWALHCWQLPCCAQDTSSAIKRVCVFCLHVGPSRSPCHLLHHVPSAPRALTHLAQHIP